MDLLYYYRKILKNKLLKEISWSFAAKGVALVLFLLLNIYLARTLGVKQFGAWSFFLSTFMILLMISFFGINASSKKFVAQYNQTKELSHVLVSSIKLRMLFSLLFALVMFVIYRPLALLINKPEFTSLFLLSIPLLILSGFVEFLKSVFMGLHRIKYNFIMNALEYGSKLLLVVIFLNFSLELVNIVASFVFATLIASVLGFYMLYKKFYIGSPKEDAKGRQGVYTREILRYSMPMLLLSVGFLVATEIDTFMLGLLSSNEQVGIYAVAKQIVIKLPHISFAIAMGTMPVFAQLDSKNKMRLTRLFYNLLRLNTAIYSIIIAAIFLSAWYFIPLVFGAEYSASVIPLLILMVFLLCFSYSAYISAFLDFRGLAKKRATNLSITMVLNITLNLMLIPQYGANGAALATSISYCPYVILNYFEVRRALGTQ